MNSLLAQAVFVRSSAPSPGPPLAFFAFLACVVLFFFAIWVGIVYMLYISLKAVPREHQRMPAGQVWLLLIPLFNLVWNFFVFQQIPESYQNYFYSRGRTDVGDAGKGIGLAYAICAVCACVPCVNYAAGPASLVLLIIFLVKVMTYRGQVGVAMPGGFPVSFAAPAPMPPPAPTQSMPPPPLE
jgi:hypothetical protein